MICLDFHPWRWQIETLWKLFFHSRCSFFQHSSSTPMNANGILRRHWFHVSLHFAADALLFYLAFLGGIQTRFGQEFDAVIVGHWPFILLTALFFSSAIYIFGFYSTHSSNKGVMKRAMALFFCVGIAVGVMIGITYVASAHPLGRGVTLIGAGFAYAASLLHHIFLLRRLRNTRERVAYIVTCSFDEMETRLFQTLGGKQLELIGVVEYNGYSATGKTKVLGKAADLAAIVRREKISRVFCTDKSLDEPTLCRQFCQLRYSGITVMQLVNLCEEINQCVALELVSSEWLLNASDEPQLLYIKKVKRFFDVAASLIGLVLALPILLLAILAIKLTSRGPVFYRQTRSGRFGREFEILKLRSMCVDAEKDGMKWSAGRNDPRVTLVGRFLRKYRIDEIPQLVHVFLGDMSFVGPRPERPEIIDMLATEIPFYKERLMVQPGITGWAQVNYPYGASIEDAKRKLEYDLYYMKHMGVFLDVFIMLDTVRIVLLGGMDSGHERDTSRYEAMREWEGDRAREVAINIRTETVEAASN